MRHALCLISVSLIAVLSIAAHAGPGPDPRQVAAIHAAGEAYPKWRRVDERPNLAPLLCRMPLPEDWGTPSHVRRSKADAAPHGRKLYYARASDRDVYLNAEAKIPVGFTIVKESFEAVRSTVQHAPPNPHSESLELPPIDWMITEKGEQLTTGKPTELFVMTKIADGDAPGSDAGWIYGAISPDGTVQNAGPIESCMHCHAAAHHERLFGLPAAPRS
ncbi:MAG TPA: hypothetical protein VH165_00275 [Kofleriaceae bacterium]|nr:hypothetical protein [Kofleriaceae bacterium]